MYNHSLEKIHERNTQHIFCLLEFTRPRFAMTKNNTSHHNCVMSITLFAQFFSSKIQLPPLFLISNIYIINIKWNIFECSRYLSITLFEINKGVPVKKTTHSVSFCSLLGRDLVFSWLRMLKQAEMAIIFIFNEKSLKRSY